MPPSGPVSRSAADSSSSAPGCSAQRSRASRGRAPGSAASGSSSPATTAGTPPVASARRSSGTCRTADRTRTAIDDHGTPSTKWARRSVSAMTAASWLALDAMSTRAVPAVAVASGIRSRCPGRAPAGPAPCGRRPAGQPPAGRRLLAGALLASLLRAAGARAGDQPGRHRQPAGHPARRGQQHRAAAPAGTQRDHAGRPVVRSAEQVREPAHGVGVRAAERVDRLVRVADRDQFPAVPGQRVQQRLLGRVGVLVLVHQHDVVGLALAVPGGGAAEQRGGDPDDFGVIVGRHRRQVEPCGVPVEKATRGDPVVAAAGPAQPGQAAAVQPAFGCAEQEVAQLGGEPAGGQRGPEPLRPAPGRPRLPFRAQHPAHLQQLLRTGQQGRRLVTGQHELPADQRIRVAVERQGQRLAGGAAQPGGDPLAQLVGRLAAEREDEHPLRVDLALGDPLYDRCHDRGGLARARPGQYQQRAARVADHGLLRGVEAQRAGRWRGPPQEPVTACLVVHLACIPAEGTDIRSRLAGSALTGYPGAGSRPSQRASRMSMHGGPAARDVRSGVPSAR